MTELGPMLVIGMVVTCPKPMWFHTLLWLLVAFSELEEEEVKETHEAVWENVY